MRMEPFMDLPMLGILLLITVDKMYFESTVPCETSGEGSSRKLSWQLWGPQVIVWDIQVKYEPYWEKKPYQKTAFDEI